MPLLLRELPAELHPATRFDHVGAAGLSNAELLQLVTGAKDMDSLSALLVHSGGLAGLSQMDLAQLIEVQGIGPAAARAITAALELGKRSLIAREELTQVRTPSDIANICMLALSLLDREVLEVYCLDSKNYIKKVARIYSGSVNSAVVRVNELFRPAIVNSCASLIMVHNHPSGDPTPSPEDVRLTEMVVEAGKLLDIDVLDHLVIGRNRYVSLKERGLGFK